MVVADLICAGMVSSGVESSGDKGVHTSSLGERRKPTVSVLLE
jgi:hypothetical protein